MGILRFLFALCVIIQHTLPILGFQMLRGSSAVQSFFIISGFYMTLVINEKYIGQKDSFRLFISNRLLRLYPCYWVVLILTLVVFAYQGIKGVGVGRLQYFIDNASHLPLTTSLLIVISNIFMFGLDIFNFLSFDPSTKSFYFGSFSDPQNHRAFNFILAPQAWTIGVELMFYLIAPFILRKNKLFLVLGLIILSFIIRFVLIQNNLYFHFWRYGFFPSELAVFLFGFLSYFLYEKVKGGKYNFLGWIFLAILIPATLFYNVLPYVNHPLHRWLYYFAIAISIPFVFSFTKKNKLDRWIGELSYPMYISHFLVMHLHKFSYINSLHFGWFTLIGTLLLSVFLVIFVASPIEKFRQSRVRDKSERRAKQEVMLTPVGA